MDQASNLRELMAANKPKKNTHFIAVTSGKGGVGKSTISANIAALLAQSGYKVGLFDADLGLANLDIILNVRIKKNLLNVLKGECGLDEIIVKVRENLFLIPGESGDEILKFNDSYLYSRIINEATILNDLDFLIIDTGAGIGGSTQTFLEASDEIIVVTVPDPAAITDAYATIKITSRIKNHIFLLMNMVRDGAEAKRIYENIKKIANANISPNLNLELLGYLQNDKSISRSIKQRTLFTQDEPNLISTIELKNGVNKILTKMERKVLDVSEYRSFGSFFKRLFE